MTVIKEFTEVSFGHDRWIVQGFQKIDDVLWVELEENTCRWPRPTAMVTFAELVQRGQIRDPYSGEEYHSAQPETDSVICLFVPEEDRRAVVDYLTERSRNAG